jgi:hypothetical protein
MATVTRIEIYPYHTYPEQMYRLCAQWHHLLHPL